MLDFIMNDLERPLFYRTEQLKPKDVVKWRHYSLLNILGASKVNFTLAVI